MQTQIPSKRKALRATEPPRSPEPARQPSPDRKRLVGYADLPEYGITYHRTYLYSLIQRGLFPRPVKLGPGRYGRTAFRVADIEQWIADRPPVKLAEEA
ncbi:AlpA family phage regulatory protein [Bradyrhizobium sp. CW7]|nr:AlpA family phage regulatory protein [Bradyrhizobium sp. CW7]